MRHGGENNGVGSPRPVSTSTDTMSTDFHLDCLPSRPMSISTDNPSRPIFDNAVSSVRRVVSLPFLYFFHLFYKKNILFLCETFSFILFSTFKPTD